MFMFPILDSDFEGHSIISSNRFGDLKVYTNKTEELAKNN
ncbi:unnamed protein product [marine sediment metagenome]|uniref:Uncharacterized protein n=1 Tax=marine sediment metagenome TaxID=412755 RepID=X1HEZ3_9ZZZZ